MNGANLVVACYYVENKINIISRKDGLYTHIYRTPDDPKNGLKKRLSEEITFNIRIKILDAGLDSDSQ